MNQAQLKVGAITRSKECNSAPNTRKVITLTETQVGYVYNSSGSLEKFGTYVLTVPVQFFLDTNEFIRNENDFYADQKVSYGPKSTRSKYNRELIALGGEKVEVDVYRVLAAFNVTDPALQHAAKKILCAGLRGHKDRVTDLEDIIDSAQKALVMESQQ